MTEIRLGMIADIEFKRAPVAPFIADLLAGRADRQKTAEGLDLGQGFPEFLDQQFPLLFSALPVANVTDNHAGSGMTLQVFEYRRRDLDGEESSVSAAGIQFAMSFSRALPL